MDDGWTRLDRVVLVCRFIYKNGIADLTLLCLTLKETYHMVDSCDKSIAGWSEEDGGKTFVIKDPAKFEQKVIPTYFKHSKFSSFVRVSKNSVWLICC